MSPGLQVYVGTIASRAQRRTARALWVGPAAVAAALCAVYTVHWPVACAAEPWSSRAGPIIPRFITDQIKVQTAKVVRKFPL